MKLSPSLIILLALAAGGCGYVHSSSPYGLSKSLELSVPVAVDHSPRADIAPRLTREVIAKLDSAAGIVVRQEAPAQLRLTVVGVNVSGGAWDNARRSEYDLPSASASREASLVVEAALETPGPPGEGPKIRRARFSGQRVFYVNDDENQTRLLEEEAWAWLAEDLAQKIAQNMFSDF